MSEVVPTAAVGLAPGMGLELQAPLRLVRGRIRFEELAREPYTPVFPDYHHRNETRRGFSDAQATLHLAGQNAVWSYAGRVGMSVPIGSTEDNPFALGRLGLPHQHVQFGTGTWDPVLGLAAGRSIGGTAFELHLAGKFTFLENRHDYRAGNRTSAMLNASHRLKAGFNGTVGLSLVREEAEHWDGRLEHEGNLGRTDLLGSVSIARMQLPLGVFGVGAQFPLMSRVNGEQFEIPVILMLNWVR